ncbi:hypothetical protein KY330_05535 [Candidatus Woesearchaeota archaeon]|nr:hypothetical protein [Candidatus Woesearchaeota archaeon]
MAKKTTASLKLKKKRWVPMVAPKLFNEQVLGESYVVDPDTLIGRKLTMNLMSLTRDVKQQNINIQFEVEGIKGANAVTKIVGYKMIPSAIKRLVRRERSKLEHSYMIKTSDNINLRVKFIILTKSKARSSATRQLLKTAADMLDKKASKTTYDNLIFEIITYKLQRFTRDKLSKIFPVRNFEVKAFRIEEKRKGTESEPVKASVDTGVEEEIEEPEEVEETEEIEETEEAKEETEEEQEAAEEELSKKSKK